MSVHTTSVSVKVPERGIISTMPNLFQKAMKNIYIFIYSL